PIGCRLPNHSRRFLESKPSTSTHPSAASNRPSGALASNRKLQIASVLDRGSRVRDPRRRRQ
ncbi:Hypothetical predicted protein, partial [Olea europaea subsp. europaea]